MIPRRLFTLTALAVAASLGPNSANANYDVTTSISSTTINGVAPTGPDTNNSFHVPSPGGSALVTLTDFAQLNIPSTVGTIPAEAVTLTGSFPGTNATIVVTELITVTNPTGGGTSASFTEVATFSLTNIGLVSPGNPTLLGPITISVLGASSSVSLPEATSTTYNELVNNAAISAMVLPAVVPEPSAVILLGLGLAGCGGIAVYRRRRLA
jgi:hypothetical protein